MNHARPRGGEKERARDHSDAMTSWWNDAGIDRADLAVKRADGTMLWHHDLALQDLPLAWARAENVRRAEVYVRPARGPAWPVLFLDDVAPQRARRVAARFACLIVQTSPQGGCHLWIRCARSLDEPQRLAVQRWLARRCRADLASVSGEHLGRLAGFKNWKRSGCWVNVLDATRSRSWSPPDELTSPSTRRTGQARPETGVDTSASGREWGWVCGLLEAGHPANGVARRLLRAARNRRRPDLDRYVRRTIRNAQHHVASQGLLRES